MKWFPSLGAALAISVLVIAFLVLDFNVAAIFVIGGPTFALGLLVGDGAVRRDRVVRKLVVAAYEADRPVAGLGDLVRLLGTRDVVKARREYLGREDARLSSAYLNGDASDY